MKSIITLFLCCFCTAIVAISQPQLKEVLNYTLSNYDIEEYHANYYPVMEYRPTGWYICFKMYPQLGVEPKRFLIWSPIDGYNISTELKRNHNPIDLLTEDSRNRRIYERELIRERDYQVNLYYGYQGWDWETIQHLEPKNILTPKEKEQLARAYSNYAIGYLSNQYGAIANDHFPNRKILTILETHEQARYDSYIYYDSKAINLYGQLLKEAPEYATPVGNIKYKYENEKLDLLMKLDIYGATQKQRNLLEHTSYPDTFTQKYKALLQPSVMPKLVITHGDNDTYYLYMMSLLHPEANLIVVCNGLLSSYYYNQYIQRNYPTLEVVFPKEMYYDQDYINLSPIKYTLKNADWKKFYDKIYTISLNSTYSSVADETRISRPKEPFEIAYQLKSQQFKLNLEERSYLQLNEFAL